MSFIFSLEQSKNKLLTGVIVFIKDYIARHTLVLSCAVTVRWRARHNSFIAAAYSLNETNVDVKF